MHKKPEITIVMPVFNRLEFLKPAVQSVINQTSVNLELLLVDDGSEADVVNYLKDIADGSRVRFLQRTSEPKGAPACRNIGWRNAKANYVFFLDSDDLLAPWACETRLKFMEKDTDVDMYLFEALEFDNKNPAYQRLRTLFKTPDPLFEFLNFQSCWQTSCVVWRKKALDKINGWDESVMSWQDGEIHIRALLKNLSYKWCNPLPDVFIRKNDSIPRISNYRSIAKYSNLYYTYMKIESYLSDRPDLRSFFVSNYKNMLFTIVEGMSKVTLLHYKDWARKEFSFSWFKLKLMGYINLYLYINRSSIHYRILYQFRKVGLPNQRKTFWSKRPFLKNDQLSLLASRLDGEVIFSEVLLFNDHLNKTNR